MALLAKQNVSFLVSGEEGECNTVDCMGTACVGVIACSAARRGLCDASEHPPF